MDNQTAKVFERTVDKIQYLGLIFCALYGGKLALDLV
jgi:hypothetical protein